MHRLETIDLGEYRGHSFFLVGFVEPAPVEGENFTPDEDAENYGVALAREAPTPLDDNVEVVTMDTRHGRPHLDKEYLPSTANAVKKVWLDEWYSYSRMRKFVLVNWKHYADRYLDLHE